jgi:hypothetical protein
MMVWITIETYSLNVQVASDLHLEFAYNENHFQMFPVRAPVLFLLGDIANPNKHVNTSRSSNDDLNHHVYEKFMQYCSQHYTTVLVLLGNHEFMNNEYLETKKRVKSLLSRYKNVLLMDKTRVYLDPVNGQIINNEPKTDSIVILGTTLWSHVPPQNEIPVHATLKEYKAVHVIDSVTRKSRFLQVKDTNQFHEIEFSWLDSEIQKAKQSHKRVYVVTHHAPVLENTNDPKWIDSEITCGFANNLTEYIRTNSKTIKTWMYGHTHWNGDFYLYPFNTTTTTTTASTRIVSNQLGYMWKPLDTDQQSFNSTFIIQLQ